MNLEPYVVGAIVGNVVLTLIRTPVRVKEARVVVVRSVSDWHRHREFLYRRRAAALYELRKKEPDDAVAEQHLRDRFDDDLDATKLRFEREAEDAQRRLSLVDRVWLRFPNSWERTHEREEELDWAARSVRGIFNDLDGD